MSNEIPEQKPIKPPPPLIMNLDRIPESDWRAYVDGRLQRFECAIESIINMHDKDTLKKAELADKLRSAWQRIIGEYRIEKRYEAFGMKAFKIMNALWGFDDNADNNDKRDGRPAETS